MKTKSNQIIGGILTVFCLAGCSAWNGVVGHPLAVLRQQHEDNEQSARHAWLMTRLQARDTQIVDLAEVGKALVRKYGRTQALATVTECWRVQTAGTSPTNCSDVIWVQGQPARVQDLAWLLNFQQDWNGK